MANDRRAFLRGIAAGALGLICTPKLVRAVLPAEPTEPNRLKWTREQWEAAFTARGHGQVRHAMVSNSSVHRLIYRFRSDHKRKNPLNFVHKDLEFWTDWRAFWGHDSKPGWPERAHRRVVLGQKNPTTNRKQLRIACRAWDRGEV